MVVDEETHDLSPERAPSAVRSSTRIAPSGPLAGLLRLMPLYVVALVMAIVLRYSALRLDNGDTWFHLLLGRHFRADWSLSNPGRTHAFRDQ